MHFLPLKTMRIELNIKKSYFFGILSALLILASIFVVYAITAGVAPNPRHLITDIAPLSTCQTNQVLQWTGSTWTCVIIPSHSLTFSQVFTCNAANSPGTTCAIGPASNWDACFLTGNYQKKQHRHT